MLVGKNNRIPSHIELFGELSARWQGTAPRNMTIQDRRHQGCAELCLETGGFIRGEMKQLVPHTLV
jgi:hypothetical protein